LSRHGYRISPGTLYPLLHDLEDAGLLSVEDRTDNGRRLRYYRATAAGRAVLVEAQAALAELARELLDAETADNHRGKVQPRARGARSTVSR
jgi:DNA-binding PadR family transcriptional regulator